MATNFWYNNASYQIDGGGINLNSDNLHLMLSEHGSGNHTPDKDDVFVSEDGDCALDGEIETVDNYEGGYDGAQRYILNSRTLTNRTATDRSELDAADQTWPSLGGTTDLTIRYCTVWNKTANSSSTDANSWVVLTLDVNDDTGLLTNGADFTVQFNAFGIGYTQQ